MNRVYKLTRLIDDVEPGFYIHPRREGAWLVLCRAGLDEMAENSIVALGQQRVVAVIDMDGVSSAVYLAEALSDTA